MPKAVPHGLTKEHIEKAIADLDAGVAHDFGPPTEYELVFDGRRYAPKAVVGLACRYLIGRPLQSDELSSGVAPGQAVYVLEQLGYTVQPISRDWSTQEVASIVADYFEMLRLELLDQPLNKTEHRQRLTALLNRRSSGSIEFKHQNISAVLIEKGLPYVEGYKPRGNYQSLLAEAVDDFLGRHAGFFDGLAEAAKLNPQEAPSVPSIRIDQVFVPPPDRIVIPTKHSKPWLSRRGRKIDFARRDAENRRLGKLGEEWALNVEKRRLSEAGRDDLAAKVEWVAQTCGDGVGFDLLSFDASNDAEKMIEVKTTGLGKFFPFAVTANELRCSEDVPDRFHLYRVFSFSTDARLFVLSGALSQTCKLNPALYTAFI